MQSKQNFYKVTKRLKKTLRVRNKKTQGDFSELKG